MTPEVIFPIVLLGLLILLAIIAFPIATKIGALSQIDPKPKGKIFLMKILSAVLIVAFLIAGMYAPYFWKKFIGKPPSYLAAAATPLHQAGEQAGVFPVTPTATRTPLPTATLVPTPTLTFTPTPTPAPTFTPTPTVMIDVWALPQDIMVYQCISEHSSGNEQVYIKSIISDTNDAQITYTRENEHQVLETFILDGIILPDKISAQGAYNRYLTFLQQWIKTYGVNGVEVFVTGLNKGYIIYSDESGVKHILNDELINEQLVVPKADTCTAQEGVVWEQATTD